MNKLRNLALLLLFIFIATISLPFVINWFFGKFIIPSSQIMYVGTNETWVIFIGGFLGASVTLVGVYWQLEKSKEHRNDDLISNTKAVYKFLEKESEYIAIEVLKPVGLFELIRDDLIIKKRDFGKCNKEEFNKIEKEAIKIIQEELDKLNSEVSLIKRDVIYNFINVSLPNQKVLLIELTNELLVIREGFNNNKVVNKKVTVLDDLITSYKFYINSVKETENKIKLAKSEFYSNN